MGKLLLDDETGNGNMVYDQTASGIDVGDDIIHENGIDFSKKNVTITDSSGASGTIIKAMILQKERQLLILFQHQLETMMV